MDSFATIRLADLVSVDRTTGNAAISAPNPAAAPGLSDEALLLAHLRNNNEQEALGTLFRRYARWVRGVAYRVLHDAAEADDLLQEIFLLVHRLCGTFDPSKGSVRFWILQMTYRRAISRRRYLTSRQFYAHVDVDQAETRRGGQEGPTRGSETSLNDTLDRRDILQVCFTHLSESQRQTLQMFFFEGYTFEEIAVKLGQTVGNARNHYYRGLEKLRKRISAGKLPGKEAV